MLNFTFHIHIFIFISNFVPYCWIGYALVIVLYDTYIKHFLRITASAATTIVCKMKKQPNFTMSYLYDLIIDTLNLAHWCHFNPTNV